MNRINTTNAGFTIVELVVVMVVLMVIVVAFFNSLTDIYSSGTITRQKSFMTYNAQAAFDVIENSVSLSSSFLTTKDSDVAEPYPPSSNGGAWSYRGDSSTSRTLILKSYSTTTNPLQRGSNSRLPVFIGSPGGPECQSQNLNYNDAEEYDTIFFLKNNTLYRRTLVNNTTQYCNPGQYQKLSCPSQVDLTAQGSGTRNASCQADDEIVAKNVTSFSINYFAETSSSTPNNAYASGASADTVRNAKTVEITMVISNTVSGKSIDSSITQRLSRLNGERT